MDGMMEENISRVSSVESTASTDSSATKKRKKRKWDQPAELFVSAGVAVPGILPPCNSVTIPGASSSSGAVQENAIGIQPKSKSPPFQVPSVHPLATATGPKINQPKIQDEVIAREIVINDADSAIRYKLTKRQTQEEIQKCSGAVVITRGKYHPSNAVPDSEKPLYLHISAGAHLETTVERIKAVDLAAAMVEEMLKQASVTNGGMVVHPGSTCVYLGFEADPSLNIAARIRGPNDQYVNHIMKETGATVILRGHGSGNPESSHDEERQLPLHLFLSSNNLKSLESAKLLAENLLDTIGREVGASRISSCNIYGGGNEVTLNNNLSTTMVTSAVNSVATLPVSSAIHTGVTTALHQGTLIQSTGVGCYPQMTITSGTSYHGYGGIYPQATPLQQVALALRQSPSLINATPAPATTATSTAANSSETSSSDKEKRRRKFQELPFASNWCAETDKGRLLKPVDQEPDLRHRNLLTFPAPKELVHSSINVMPRPPPKIMPPPPPPPKFNSPAPALKVTKSNALEKPKQDTIPDTLVKLMEYGEEDEEDDETTEEPNKGYLNGLAAPKPFWAV